MPKATLTFDLPEEESDFHQAVNGGKYLIAIQELYNEFRSKSKHAQETGSWADAYDLFNRVLSENNLDPWEEM